MQIVLLEPEIPPNTGNIARLCAATGTVLHLIEPLGFRLTDRAVRRAGLDYWESVDIRRHVDLEAFLRSDADVRLWLFSTAGRHAHTTPRYLPGDALLFGNETRGLPDAVLERYADRVVGIPMKSDHVRSLNLSTSVAIALYEALRQTQPRLPRRAEGHGKPFRDALGAV